MVAGDLYTHNSPRSEPSTSSDEIMVSTWKNGQMLKNSSMSSAEFQENNLGSCSNQNLIGAFDQVCTFVRRENQRYSQILQACTATVRPSVKADYLFRLLLTLDTTTLVPSTPTTVENRAEETVNVIHRKRKKFTVPKSSLPMTGLLYDFLKDP